MIRSRTDRALLVALALAAASGAARAFELGELMRLLGANRGGSATYDEQRYVQGLDAPLHSSGTLSYTAPDRFTRHMEQPRAETVSVAGNTLTLTKNGKTRNVALDSVPEMGAIVAAMRGTLSGDAGALERWFRPQVEGSAERWSLVLVPSEERIAARVATILIGGRHGEVRRVEVRLADGDRSVMEIEPLAAAKRASVAR